MVNIEQTDDELAPSNQSGEAEEGARMPQYRCYFITSQDKIFCSEDINAETEYRAVEKIRERFAELRHLPKFELWLGTTRVWSEMREARVG